MCCVQLEGLARRREEMAQLEARIARITARFDATASATAKELMVRGVRLDAPVRGV
jgi:BMFP domain-containing protein YqiC